ncbi:MAG: hypothetical protein HY366_01645 [Candidatus Aenigmarchaeota archaeon]|nr:hypothetical protein [Candidatus Aenigmarchaeota archaeon]
MPLDLATPLAPLFVPIHVLALLVGIYGAYGANKMKQNLWAIVFGLWAISELVYLTVHLNLNIVTQLTAHTLQEVFLLVGFLYVVYSSRKTM